MSSASAVRAILSKSPRISSLPPTKDVLQGTELLLLLSTRDVLRSSYTSLLSSTPQSYDVVSTSLNASVSFLQSFKFFQDMSRDNDISYYKVGRGKVGKDDETGEEFSFEMQKKGYKHCIPRSMVSEGEKLAFGQTLLQHAVHELNKAKEEVLSGGMDSAAMPLLGASIFMDTTSGAGSSLCAGGLECLENQFSSVVEADTPMPDVFCVEGCHTAERLEQLRELVKKNEKRMVRLSLANTTGHYIENDFETELGFDTPVVVLREGKVDEIISNS